MVRLLVILSVNTNIKTPRNDDGFEQIIIHNLSCTLEKEDGDVFSYGKLRFRSIDEVMGPH